MKPKWIWLQENIGPDSYAEFLFNVRSNHESGLLKIAVDSNYALYVNGVFIDCGAYHSYPGKPVLDLINVPLMKGNNEFKIVVYYNGTSGNMFYAKDDPGLYFELSNEDGIIAISDEKVLSKKSDKYINNQRKNITLQLGYKQFYDFNKKEGEYRPSIIVEKSQSFTERPNKKCIFLGRSESTLLKKEENKILFDTLKENVGYLDFEIESDSEQDITIAFGEHIVDGWVRQHIEQRDFSFEIKLAPGMNKMMFPLKRIGARYLEIHHKNLVKVRYLGLFLTEYPFVEKPYKFDNELDQRIYETAIHTLKCCYHEHFEDCPWREQGLYTLDSRHASLASYYAFDNPEAILSSINLIINDRMHDGQLSICFPCDLELVIPSFTLHFFTLVWENYIHTNNLQVLKDANEKMDTIIETFSKNMKSGLIQEFVGNSYWNFFEWNKGYDGNSGLPIKSEILINLLFLNALNIKNRVNDLLGSSVSYNPQIEELKKNINEQFFDKEKGLYFFSNELKRYSVLVNSLCLLYDVVPSNLKEDILQKIMNDESLDQPTLSMKAFYYDAILKIKPEFQEFIIDDIRKTYKKMLDNGATSFYETELGEKDFGGAGSLCHAWSAIVIYYYNLFGLNKAQLNP